MTVGWAAAYALFGLGQRGWGGVVPCELVKYDARSEDEDSERKRTVRSERERVGVGMRLVSVEL